MERGNLKLRMLDKFVGIPLVFFCGLTKFKKAKLAKKIQRIAILNTAAIGDTVLFFGCITDIRINFPEAEIIFFSGNQNYSMAKMHPEIDTVVRLPIKNPFKTISLVRNQGGFDVIIDFMPWPRVNALIAFFSKSDVKIGFKTSGQHRHYVYDYTIQHSNVLHEIENVRALLVPLKINSTSLPKISIAKRLRRDLVILHMFPSGFKSHFKRWPKENWVALARALMKSGFTVGITGGPADIANGEEMANIFFRDPRFANYAGKLSLPETIELLANANLVISVNTGIMHVAAALNCNLVALHGPTDSRRWGPLNKNSISIQSPHKDAPCLNLGFEYKCKNQNCNCMSLIPVESVLRSALSLLNINGQNSV
jgi:heptosyltransferase I